MIGESTFNGEQLIPLAEAATLAPGHPHVSAIWRWCRKGIRAGGVRVFLDHSRYGRRVFTSREALVRFGRALADADAEHFLRDDNRAPTPRTVIATARSREICRAEAALEAAGL